MAETVARAGAGVVLMHMQGTPQTMQQRPGYRDVVAEVREFFAERLSAARAAGIAPECVALDPGIGFGKTVEHNLALLRELGSLGAGGRPLVVGVSRKSFLAQITGDQGLADRLWPTVAITALAREKGARVLRVHEVRPNVAALHVAEALLCRE
jgi:dihydropteroate synthase